MISTRSRTSELLFRLVYERANITFSYKPQELTVQEEGQIKGTEVPMDNSSVSIYSGISNTVLNQIKNIEVEGSFGTKIDTLARHILFLRENDPGAKSVVFSQFRDFLEVLGRAFAQFRIGFTGIDRKGGVEKFKSDPSVGEALHLSPVRHVQQDSTNNGAD